MSRVEWSEKLSIGVPIVDKQHQQIIALICELEDAVRDNVGNKLLSASISSLVNYAKLHFVEEESLMAGVNYPGLGKHKLFHQYFLARISVFSERMENGEPEVAEDLLTFLKLWFIDHICVSDCEYVPHLNATAQS